MKCLWGLSCGHISYLRSHYQVPLSLNWGPISYLRYQVPLRSYFLLKVSYEVPLRSWLRPRFILQVSLSSPFEVLIEVLFHTWGLISAPFEVLFEVLFHTWGLISAPFEVIRWRPYFILEVSYQLALRSYFINKAP
jgi:hypothetical protein